MRMSDSSSFVSLNIPQRIEEFGTRLICVRYISILRSFRRDCRRYVCLTLSEGNADESENIISQFALDVQLAEARAFYSFQGMMEQVHSETYSLLIETYVRDQQEKDFLFRGMETSELNPI